jgi:hypothetical protein
VRRRGGEGGGMEREEAASYEEGTLEVLVLVFV